MSYYECHVCGESFESDYVGGRQTPKYCTDCKAFPETGKAVVYGLRANGGHVRYIGSTKNPVKRLSTHRCPDCYRESQPELASWMDKVGPDNVRMEILAVTSLENQRRAEQRAILKHRHELVNMRCAKQKALTESETNAILATFLETH